MRARTVLAALTVGASAILPAEEAYQYIVSGWPVANVNYSAASAATSLETATRRTASAAFGLEARFRTWDESDGIALRSDRRKGFVLTIR